MTPDHAAQLLQALHATDAFQGVRFELAGDASLLHRATRMLLVSRDTTPPSPQSPWLRAVISEANRAIQDGETLITGAGRVAYDLPLWLSAQRRAPVVVVHSDAQALPVEIPDGSLRVIAHGPLADEKRDLLLGTLAASATRIAVRDGGQMALVASLMLGRGRPLRDAEVEKKDPTPRERWPKTALASFPADWPYLTHFTREPDGPWLGETYADYLGWLSNPDSARRDSFATLCRILKERRVRSARRLIRGGWPITCWTVLPPDHVAQLRGWRKGLRRWNFTPYGLAIHRDALETLGARAVRYDETESDPFTQAPRSGSYDWTAEREWRVLGDVDFNEVPKEKMLVLTATELEAEMVRETMGLQARATEILDV